MEAQIFVEIQGGINLFNIMEEGWFHLGGDF